MHIAHIKDGEVITVQQVAKILGLKRRQVAYLAKKGAIPDVTRPDGYHCAFFNTPAFRDWIEWKRRKVKARKQPPSSKPPRTNTGIITIHGIRAEFDLVRRKIEPSIDSWDKEVLEDVRLELSAFIHFYSRITRALEAKAGQR